MHLRSSAPISSKHLLAPFVPQGHPSAVSCSERICGVQLSQLQPARMVLGGIWKLGDNVRGTLELPGSFMARDSHFGRKKKTAEKGIHRSNR